VRALSKATGISWKRCHEILADTSREMGLMMDDKAVWGRLLKERGFRKMVVPDSFPDDYSIRDFCKDHPVGTYILATNSHVVCVDDGNFFDTFDSGAEIPIFYWRRY
jgi:hypothetical protein